VPRRRKGVKVTGVKALRGERVTPSLVPRPRDIVDDERDVARDQNLVVIDDDDITRDHE